MRRSCSWERCEKDEGQKGEDNEVEEDQPRYAHCFLPFSLIPVYCQHAPFFYTDVHFSSNVRDGLLGRENFRDTREIDEIEDQTGVSSTQCINSHDGEEQPLEKDLDET